MNELDGLEGRLTASVIADRIGITRSVIVNALRNDIYDEPINHFVATFIGESNILPGVMIEDYLV